MIKDKNNFHKPPYPWFGSKKGIAELVWNRLGGISGYIEPFFGSGAVFLAQEKNRARQEVINDFDGYVVNFWRSVKHDPEAVAKFAAYPSSELDLQARHIWLVQRKKTLVNELRANPDFFDAKVAGWWVWGASLWIGDEWCSGTGKYSASSDGTKLVKAKEGQAVAMKRQRNGGAGVMREAVIDGEQVSREKFVLEYIRFLHERTKDATVLCGDWARAVTPSNYSSTGITGIVLDPPYDEGMHSMRYANQSSDGVAKKVTKWCMENGANPKLRIALCGYEGEHNILEKMGWKKIAWDAGKGYGAQRKDGENKNGKKERIWFSPNCIGA